MPTLEDVLGFALGPPPGDPTLTAGADQVGGTVVNVGALAPGSGSTSDEMLVRSDGTVARVTPRTISAAAWGVQSGTGIAVATNTTNLQSAINIAGALGCILELPYTGSNTLRINATLSVTAAMTGLSVLGAGRYGGTRIEMTVDNTPHFTISDASGTGSGHSMTFGHLQFRWTNPQPSTNTSAAAFSYTGPGPGATFFWHHYHDITIINGAAGWVNNGSGTSYLTIWNSTWERIQFQGTSLQCMNLVPPTGAAAGMPINTFKDIRVFNAGTVSNDGTQPAFNLFGEWNIKGLDVEDWQNRILVSNGGNNCSIEGMHIERYQLNVLAPAIEIDATTQATVDGVQVTSISGTQAGADLPVVKCAGSSSFLRIGNINTPSGMVAFSTDGNSKVETYGCNAPINTADTTTIKSWVSDNGLPPTIPAAGLPAAASGFAGRQFYVLGGAGVADTLQICAKSSTATYSWKTIVSG